LSPGRRIQEGQKEGSHHLRPLSSFTGYIGTLNITATLRHLWVNIMHAR